MFPATKKQRGNQEEDAKRLEGVSIPQKFAWTGLKRENSTENSFAMEGLVLWNVLGFAMFDSTDFASFSLVNKEWNHVVKALEPPVMYRIRELLSCRDKIPQKKITAQDMEHLTTVFHLLETRDSPLYRKDKTEASKCSSSTCCVEPWPFLQPHFSLSLVRFVYYGATQRSPNNCSREIYSLICQYLSSITRRSVDHAIQSLQMDPSSAVLKEVVEHWTQWAGIVQRVKGIAGYLDRYYVHHHSLNSLQEHARVSLEAAVAQSKDQLMPRVSCLLQHINDHYETMDQKILIDVYRASEKLLSFSLLGSNCDSVEGAKIQTHFERFQVIMEERILQEKQHASTVNTTDVTLKNNASTDGPMLTIIFPNGTKLFANAHFVESSSLLSNLHLSKGDSIRWAIDKDIPPFQKALEFYAMDAQNPMPPLQKPLQSSVLSDLVGEQYSEFINALDQTTLFGALLFSTFLDLEKLLDLACAAVAVQIRV